MTSFVLLAWPILAILVSVNRTVTKAVIWATIPPYLLLPEATAVSLSGLPDLDKTNVISIGLILGFLVSKKDLRAADADGSAGDQVASASLFKSIFLAGIFVGGGFTILANPETIRFGTTVLPGLGVRSSSRQSHWPQPSFIGYESLA